VLAPTEGQGHEEGVSLDMRSVHSYFRRCFFAILGIILTVGESADAELSGLTFTQEASLNDREGVREKAWRRTSPRRSGGDTSAASIAICNGPVKKKLRSKVHRSYYCFLFTSAVQVVSIPTPYHDESCSKCYGVKAQ
jgi:hypothetical protein